MEQERLHSCSATKEAYGNTELEKGVAAGIFSKFRHVKNVLELI
jgi:hypothetical protein